MTTQIRCNVKNCKHNKENENLCNAKEIQISNVNHSNDMEAGTFIDPAPAPTSYETQCVSFLANK